jgi:8-oxo-dGTP pyrophosphatase MutT (NUDIX family)
VNESPVTYTHPSVLEGIEAGADWADPVMDPAEIDWDERLKRAVIPFGVVGGRPVNPRESTGIRYGRNEFGHWGEALMADALVTVTYCGTRHLLMIERGDGHGWAVPGGHVEPGEAALYAAVRELYEETGLTAWARGATVREMPPRYVPDPRSSDEAWAVTVPVHIDLGDRDAAPAVLGGDDARRAEWVPAAAFGQLADALDYRYGGRVFAAHEEMLREFLGAAATSGQEGRP